MAAVGICECPEELSEVCCRQETFQCAAQMQDYLELIFQMEKNVCYYIEGKEVQLMPGDILLINRNIPHTVSCPEAGCIHFHLAARPEFFDKALLMLQERKWGSQFLLNMMWQSNQTPGYTHFHLGECYFVGNLIENLAMAVLMDQGNDSLSQYLMGVLLLYLSGMTEHASKDSSRTYKDTIIAETLRYIDLQYRTASLSQIAEDFHQPLPLLSKLIKQETGLTFRELLMNKRFEKAAVLLMETELPVEKVAVNIGYENQSYFHLQFKKRYGVTPRQYRMQYKREKNSK